MAGVGLDGATTAGLAGATAAGLAGAYKILSRHNPLDMNKHFVFKIMNSLHDDRDKPPSCKLHYAEIEYSL